jgi:hypothetical protein
MVELQPEQRLRDIREFKWLNLGGGQNSEAERPAQTFSS